MQMKDGIHCFVGCFSVNCDPTASFIELETLPGHVVSPWWKELFFLLLSHIRRGFKRSRGGAGRVGRDLIWGGMTGVAQPDEMLGWERLDCWDHPLVVMRITMKRRVKNHTAAPLPPLDSGKMLNCSVNVAYMATLTI